MILKYDIQIDNTAIDARIQILINQIYKLLPSREEGFQWEKPLETIMQELSGMQRLMIDKADLYLPLLSKLQGLYLLTTEQDFLLYRRTIFECLGLLNSLRSKICHQKP